MFCVLNDSFFVTKAMQMWGGGETLRKCFISVFAFVPLVGFLSGLGFYCVFIRGML